MMLGAHISQEQLKRYGARDLPPQEWLAAARHLEQCRACAAALGQLNYGTASRRAAIFSLTPETAEPFHLDFAAHLRPFVDGEADSATREIVASHITNCAMCASEVRDLQDFRAGLQFRTQQLAPVTPTTWARLAGWWHGGTQSGTARWILVSLALILLTLAGWRAWQQRRPEPKSAQVRQETPLPPLPETSVTPGVTATPPIIATPAVVPTVMPLRRRVALPTVPARETIAARRPVQINRAVLLDDNGQRAGLDAQGHLVGYESLPDDTQALIRQALASQRVELPAALGDLRTRNAKTRSGAKNAGDNFMLSSPAGVVELSAQPLFEWTPLPDTVSYIVTVADFPASGFLLRSPVLNRNQWTPDAPLPRGRLYTWQVSALRKDAPALLAPSSQAATIRFYVLGEKELQEVERVSQSGSHLARGLVYARVGLLKQAVAELTVLVKANPQSSLARRLLKKIQSAQGLRKKAGM